MSYTASAGVNSINLGDWLDANKSYLADGFYGLEIDNGTDKFYLSLIIASAGLSLPVSPEEQEYVKKIIVYDKVLGLMLEIPPNSPTIPYTERFMTMIYLHKDQEGLGRIIIRGYLEDMDTGWARRGIWEITYSFKSLTALAQFLANHAYPRTYDSDVLNAVVTIVSKYPTKATTILSLYGITPLFGRANILDYTIIADPETNTYQVKVTIYARIGDLWEDILMALTAFCAGALAGAFVGSFVPVIGTGVGALIGGIATVVTFALTKKFSTTEVTETTEEKTAVKNTAEQGKQNVTQNKDKALSDLDVLVQQGEVTEHAAEILRADILALYNASIRAIEEVYEEAVKKIDEAYNKGYDKGVSESKTWIVGAGVGGFALGLLLGRR